MNALHEAHDMFAPEFAEVCCVCGDESKNLLDCDSGYACAYCSEKMLENEPVQEESNFSKIANNLFGHTVIENEIG